MDTDDYIARRLQTETDWYDQRANREQRYYYGLSILAFAASAAVPTSIALGSPDWLPAIMGSLVAIATGVLSIKKCQENWLNYRKTAELLKKERHFFEMGAGPYSGLPKEEASHQLVERVEALISVEHQAWLQGHEVARTRAPL
jgi:hypothetical protein